MKWNTCRSFSSLIPQAFSEYLSDARGFPNENNHFLFLPEDEWPVPVKGDRKARQDDVAPEINLDKMVEWWVSELAVISHSWVVTFFQSMWEARNEERRQEVGTR